MFPLVKDYWCLSLCSRFESYIENKLLNQTFIYFYSIHNTKNEIFWKLNVLFCLCEVSNEFKIAVKCPSWSINNKQMFLDTYFHDSKYKVHFNSKTIRKCHILWWNLKSSFLYFFENSRNQGVHRLPCPLNTANEMTGLILKTRLMVSLLCTHFVPDEHSLKSILVGAGATCHRLHLGHSTGSNLGGGNPNSWNESY